MAENKLTIRKQLLGALVGATIALVLYQGYAFTSSRLQAAVWPTKTLTGGDYDRNSSSSPIRYIDPHVVARTSSYVAPAAAALARKAQSSSGSPDYTGPSGAAMNESAHLPAIPEAPPPEENSYADSRAAGLSVPAEEPLQEDTQPVAPNVSEHVDKLPQSGFGLDLIAFAALGAVMGSRKARRKKM